MLTLTTHPLPLLMLGLAVVTVGNACAPGPVRTTSVVRPTQSTQSTAAQSRDVPLHVPGVPALPDVVTVVPFQLWYGVKHDWPGAWVMFPAEVEGHAGNYILDTGSPDFHLNRDSFPPDPRTATLRGDETAHITVHTERVGTLAASVDSIDIGPPIPQPTNATVSIDYDSLGTNKQAANGTFSLNGMEPFEVIIDYVHQRLVWIRLDAAGRRLADVPAYTPLGTVPLVPTGIHLTPMFAPQWWGIAVRRGGAVDTLLVDSGTQGETGLTKDEQRLAADQLHQAALSNQPVGGTLPTAIATAIALPEPKARDLNVLGYFFLQQLGMVGFNLRTRQMLLYR